MSQQRNQVKCTHCGGEYFELYEDSEGNRVAECSLCGEAQIP